MKLLTCFLTILFISSSFFALHAQDNADDLRTEGSALAAKARDQVADGDYEAAAENFEKAAQKFEDAGDVAQANTERINAGAAYDNAAEEAAAAEKHAKAADLYDKAAKAYDKGGLKGKADSSRRNRDFHLSMIVVQNALGTGRTTGHIATINVQNNGDLPIAIAAQTFFIPSNGRHQSYVGTTPDGTTIAPGQSAQIPVQGYCVDVHTPPVANGASMPSLDDWVPVLPQIVPPGDPTSISTQLQVPGPMNPPGAEATPEAPTLVLTFGTSPMPGFDPSQIPDLINSPGFTEIDPNSESTFTGTWPGTDLPMGGTIDPNSNPTTYAPLVVEIVTRVTTATDYLQGSGLLDTPFSADPERERPSITQQTIWISMGILTGKEYTKDDFTENIYDQFEQRTNTPISALNDEGKEKVDEGVDDFWNSFALTGVKAKVIKNKTDEGGSSLIAVALEDAKKKSDLPKASQPAYERYAGLRMFDKKMTHKEACEKCSAAGVDPDSELGKAYKRIYEN